MILLSSMEQIGRKLWTKKKWDEYILSNNTKAIERSVMMYEDPTNEKLECLIDKPKWKSTIDKKVNYLLARKPICDTQQERLDNLSDVIRETAKQLLLRGSLIWIVQGDDISLEKKPMIMSNTIAIYQDENKEEAAAYIRRRYEIQLEKMTGEEEKIELLELYYKDSDRWVRETFCYSNPFMDKQEAFDGEIDIIEMKRTGDAPLYAYVEGLILAFDHDMNEQDKTVEANAKPLIEVRGYTGTDNDDIRQAVEIDGIVKTDGNGGVNIHMRSMDSSAHDLWQRRLSQEYCEAACIVSKENELVYAQSGKAMDRLFVDMDNDAKQLGHTLEMALKQYFSILGVEDIDIIWNTDRPVDDASIISAIVQSRGLVSDETLLEQHPWVDDVEREKERKAAEASQGFEDLQDADFDGEQF